MSASDTEHGQKRWVIGAYLHNLDRLGRVVRRINDKLGILVMMHEGEDTIAGALRDHQFELFSEEYEADIRSRLRGQSSVLPVTGQ